jgi:hypothetical protein
MTDWEQMLGGHMGAVLSGLAARRDRQPILGFRLGRTSDLTPDTR